MREKLTILLIAKLHVWSQVCTPFMGQNPPNDPGLALACSRAQIQLTRLIKRIDLLDTVQSSDNADIRSQTKKKESR
jgi:hypothetical protein